MPTSVIGEHLLETCRARPASTAVVWRRVQRAISFGELYEQYEVVRAALVRHGLGRGSCVVSRVGNQPVFFPLFVACLDVGAVLLPLGEATDVEASAIVGNAGADAIVSDRLLPLASIGETQLDSDVWLRRLAHGSETRRYGESLLIKLTSGSTDLPKATLTGELALINDARNIATGMDIRFEDITIAAIPLSHAYAIGNVVMPLVLQGTAVALLPSFNPSQFLRDAESTHATVFPGVPFMFDQLRIALQHERLPGALRLLITAGARIDASTVRWFREHANRKIHSFYGTSETGGITFDDSDELSDPLHLGRPLPNVTVEIRHTPGRVFVRGTGLAFGYANPGGTNAISAFQDGGFLTGDLGYLDSHGRLVLTGRVSSLVNVAGRKVDPAEVERVLTAFTDVTDARVVGVDCRTRGQELVAFVLRANTGVTPLALRQSCAETLSPYKIPRRFIFLDRWPVDSRGKVDRRALEALAVTRRSPNPRLE